MGKATVFDPLNPGQSGVGVIGSPFTPTLPDMGTPAQMYGYANQSIASSAAYVQQLGLIMAGTEPPKITPEFPTGGAAPVPQQDSAPEFAPIALKDWTAPAAFAGDVSVDSYLPQPFDAAPPALVVGTAPTPPTDPVPTAPGVDFSFQMPSLSVALPAAPQLLTLDVRRFDGVALPVVDTTVPELVAVAPTPVAYQPGAGYASALLEALRTKLRARIEQGGTGLAPDVERAIWDRAREREAIAADDAIRDLERMEALGYAFPPGVYVDARLRINTEMRARTISASRDIAIEQARLELENVGKSLDLAVGVESQMMTYTNQVEQRLFESARYATEAGIAIHNAKVQAYAAYLDAYKTKVAIYDAQVRVELGRVQAYQAEMQAEATKAEINTALVGQYRTQVDAALANVEVFKAEVQAILAKAEIERARIEMFGEQVRAHTARIGAYTAGVEGFRATVQAEAVKQEAYKSQVEAYRARVQAGVAAAEAKIEEFKGRIAAKTAEWEGYKAAVTSESARAQAIAASNASLADRFKAEVAGTAAYNETLTRQWQVALDQAQRVTEIGVSAARANAELYMTTRSLALDAAKVGAQVSSQVSAAALNAVNYSFSVGESLGFSNSFGLSNSAANSASSSDSTSDTSITSNSTQSIYYYGGSA